MKKQPGFAVLEIVLVAALAAVVIGAVYLATSKAKPTTSSSPVKTTARATEPAQPGNIESAKDIDKSIKENDAETTTDIDSDLSQVDQDLKDL